MKKKLYMAIADILVLKKRDDAITRNKHDKKIKYKINRKSSQIKRLSKSGQYKAKKNEHHKSSVRAKVEHVFFVIKNLFSVRKTRYRGKRDQIVKLYILFAIAKAIILTYELVN